MKLRVVISNPWLSERRVTYGTEPSEYQLKLYNVPGEIIPFRFPMSTPRLNFSVTTLLIMRQKMLMLRVKYLTVKSEKIVKNL